MVVRVSRGAGAADEAAAAELLAAQGLAARPWGDPPGGRYARHDHAYHKVLYCVAGSITFHTAEGDYPLGAGDRLDIGPGTAHSATVGPAGVRCVEGGG